MFSYVSGLFIFGTLVIIASITVISLIFMIVKKKKISILQIFFSVISIPILIFPGTFFLDYLKDLPNVWSVHPSKYEGKCKITIDHSSRSSTLWVDFGKHSVDFSPEEYPKVEKGTYFCKVEYFSNSESGVSLKVYKSMNE